jgi:hypothetical protein
VSTLGAERSREAIREADARSEARAPLYISFAILHTTQTGGRGADDEMPEARAPLYISFAILHTTQTGGRADDEMSEARPRCVAAP